jgi:hypothetical protein
MTKWVEDRIYEIMNSLHNDSKLRGLFDIEIKKSQSRYPRSEYFERIEKCYERAKLKLKDENI